MTYPQPDILGTVTLVVRNLNICRSYYIKSLGFKIRSETANRVVLGTGTRDLLVLESNPEAERAPNSTGLYHVAFLLPTREDLAIELRHIIEAKVPLAGMSDHLVSEALYLYDPEGNGIEIYRDRTPDQWVWKNGEVEMATAPLDVDDLLKSAPSTSGEYSGLADGAIIGHVHLRVAHLEPVEHFYSEIIGLDITTRSYPGALFMSKGGYHHHIGLNTWRSANAPEPPEGPAGLKEFEILLEPDEVERIQERATAGGYRISTASTGFVLADPSGNRMLIKSK